MNIGTLKGVLFLTGLLIIYSDLILVPAVNRYWEFVPVLTLDAYNMIAASITLTISFNNNSIILYLSVKYASDFWTPLPSMTFKNFYYRDFTLFVFIFLFWA